jgi:hypothetical protein
MAVMRPPRSRSIAIQEDSVAAGAGSLWGGPEGAAGVEAEPAEPEQAGAEQREGDVVGQQCMTSIVAAGADDQCCHSGRRCGVDMNDRATGKVEGTIGREESAAPDPVGHRGVDQQGPGERKDHVGREAHAFDDRTRDERDGDDGKRALKCHEEQMRNALPGFEADMRERCKVEMPDDGRTRSEGERVAEEGPDDGHGSDHGEAHHHGVQGILRADHATVEECEGRGHEQHEGRGDEHPREVGGLNGGRFSLHARIEYNATHACPIQNACGLHAGPPRPC